MPDTPNEGWLRRRFRPADSFTERASIPYTRAWKIALRTVHLMAIGMLFGGHAFHAAAGELKPWLYVAIATGAGMIFFEAYPSLHFVFEGWGLFLLVKLALLCTIPFAWSARVPILFTVVALGSVGSHMPGRFRHYSVLYRRVVKR
jgi:hypothetical protein